MYLVYVDESGTPSYQDRASRPVFVLAGLVIHEHQLPEVDQSAQQVKKRFFRKKWEHEGELKSQEIKGALNGQAKKEPYSNLSQKRASALADAVCGLYHSANMRLLAVAVDKNAVLQRYENKAWPVYDIAYGVLAIQICQFLDAAGTDEKAVVVMDHNTDAKNRLLDLVQAAQTMSRYWRTPINIERIVEKPFFADSRRHNGIQLADIAAYTIFRALTRGDFTTDFFRAVSGCLFTVNGTIDAFGFKGFPEYETPGRMSIPVSTWQLLKQELAAGQQGVDK